MGQQHQEDPPKLPMKRMVFLEAPVGAAWFLDHKDEEYYIRIEGMDVRYVIPLKGNLHFELGSLVDEFIEVISTIQAD